MASATNNGSAPHVGEVVEESSLMVLNASEINQQIATAKAYPRDIKQFRLKASELVTMDEETAGECIYAKPVDGNFVKGASIRFAETLMYAYGNLRAGARIVEEGQQFITAQGVCMDLEANIAHTADVKRRIVGKNGKRCGPSMIETTCAAACSIARRNAILSAIPKPIWRPIYNAARDHSIGDAKTLPAKRKSMLAHFAKLHITPERILSKLSLESEAEITLEHLEILRGLATAIKDGESIDEVFGNGEQEAGSKVGRSSLTDELDGVATKGADMGDPSQPTAEELAEQASGRTRQANLLDKGSKHPE